MLAILLSTTFLRERPRNNYYSKRHVFGLK